MYISFFLSLSLSFWLTVSLSSLCCWQIASSAINSKRAAWRQIFLKILSTCCCCCCCWPRNATIKINSNMLYTSLNIPAQPPEAESLFSSRNELASSWTSAGIKLQDSQWCSSLGEASFRWFIFDSAVRYLILVRPRRASFGLLSFGGEVRLLHTHTPHTHIHMFAHAPTFIAKVACQRYTRPDKCRWYLIKSGPACIYLCIYYGGI